MDRRGYGEAAGTLWGRRTCQGLCDTVSRLVLRAAERESSGHADGKLAEKRKNKTKPRDGFNSHQATFLYQMIFRLFLPVLPSACTSIRVCVDLKEEWHSRQASLAVSMKGLFWK